MHIRKFCHTALALLGRLALAPDRLAGPGAAPIAFGASSAGDFYCLGHVPLCTGDPGDDVCTAVTNVHPSPALARDDCGSLSALHRYVAATKNAVVDLCREQCVVRPGSLLLAVRIR